MLVELHCRLMTNGQCELQTTHHWYDAKKRFWGENGTRTGLSGFLPFSTLTALQVFCHR